MASKSLCLLVMAFLCFLMVLQHSSDFVVGGGDGCLHGGIASQGIQTRKVLVHGSDGKKTSVEWELREAPMGPDPLHHNGAHPKKPRTTP